MKLPINKYVRKFHRWAALLCFLPLSIVIATGLLLQLKKQVPWVQPPTQEGVASVPLIGFSEILAAAKKDERAAIANWNDIDRLDVRPDKGIVKIRSKNRWELQVDLKTGYVLSSKYRRSDLIESLHDGSFFSDAAKLWVFLPNGVLLLGLWLTGIYLWYLPFQAKRKKAKRLAAKKD